MEEVAKMYCHVREFGLEIGFMDHFNTRLMTTLNYSISRPRRKHRSLLCSNRFRGKALLSNGCVYLLIKNLLPSSGCCFVVSRSLSSNRSTRYSMYYSYFIWGHGIAGFENACFMVSPVMVVGGRAGVARHEATWPLLTPVPPRHLTNHEYSLSYLKFL
jgi:hypothetical protein